MSKDDENKARLKKMKDYTSHKLVFSLIGGFMLDVFGGWDNLMAFLVMLVVVDTISGVFKAIKTKTLSSEAMRTGLFKKAMVALIVAIAVQADKVVLDYFGHPVLFHWNDAVYNIYIRDAFIIWFCLEEAISVLENAAIIGVALPKWLKDILQAIDDGIQATTPSQIVEFLEKYFKIRIGDGSRVKDEKAEEKPTEEEPKDKQ